ncbi:MAG: hypothetical protein EOP51_31445, partial [Sphingobacteriales bacterium]
MLKFLPENWPAMRRLVEESNERFVPEQPDLRAGTTESFASPRSRFRQICLLVFGMLALLSPAAMAQSTITTTFTNNNGSGMVTFNLQNNNGYDIIITEIGSITGASGLKTAEIYYKTSAINGTPGAITAANGWTLGATGSYTGVANTANTTAQAMITGMSLTIPAGQTYGMAFSTASLRYSTLTAGTYTETAGGVSLITGTNIGWGGVVAPGSPTLGPRGFIGYITFIPAVACTNPVTPGTASATPGSVCTGNNFDLSLTGFSGGTGTVIQWQSSPTGAAGTFTNIPGGTGINYTTSQSSTTFYRASVTCSGGTPAFSNTVQVISPPAFPAGTYTINSALPTGGTNYNSFTAAVNALSCGIAGPVTFNVLPGTNGIYNEQITIPQIGGASATSRVTFNGNGHTLSFASANTNARAVIKLDGA